MKITGECPKGVPTRDPERYQMTDTHRRIIAELVALGATENGFRAAVESAVGERFEEAALMSPDAYIIAPMLSLVDVYEVEVTHAIDEAKAGKIAAWAVWLRDRGWTMRLAVFDPLGGRTEMDPFTMRMTEGELDKVRDLMENLGSRITP